MGDALKPVIIYLQFSSCGKGITSVGLFNDMMDRRNMFEDFSWNLVCVHLPKVRSTGLLFLTMIKKIRRSVQAMLVIMAFSKIKNWLEFHFGSWMEQHTLLCNSTVKKETKKKHWQVPMHWIWDCSTIMNHDPVIEHYICCHSDANFRGQDDTLGSWF